VIGEGEIGIAGDAAQPAKKQVKIKVNMFFIVSLIALF
jgi:hypothetical protein